MIAKSVSGHVVDESIHMDLASNIIKILFSDDLDRMFFSLSHFRWYPAKFSSLSFFSFFILYDYDDGYFGTCR